MMLPREDAAGSSSQTPLVLASILCLSLLLLLLSFTSFDPLSYLLGSNSLSKIQKPLVSALFFAARVDISSDRRKQSPGWHLGAVLLTSRVGIRTSMPLVSGVVITSGRQWHYNDESLHLGLLGMMCR